MRPEEIWGVILLIGTILIILKILLPSRLFSRILFRISTFILKFPFIRKLASTKGFRKFKPESEPDGFRGIKWGTDISSLEGDMKYQYDVPKLDWLREIKTYTRTGDELRLGLAELRQIEYQFIGGYFFAVLAEAKDSQNWNLLKEAVSEKYGEGFPVYINKDQYCWKGTNTEVLLEYDRTSGEGPGR